MFKVNSEKWVKKFNKNLLLYAKIVIIETLLVFFFCCCIFSAYVCVCMCLLCVCMCVCAITNSKVVKLNGNFNVRYMQDALHFCLFLHHHHLLLLLNLQSILSIYSIFNRLFKQMSALRTWFVHVSQFSYYCFLHIYFK